jgi:class 3 adenylate cyclase/tetratricopeptide (TPR) repeat protein
MPTCGQCGRENPDDSRFCNACAAPLVAGVPPPREERKVVTVLFADLVGFTSRAERLDPEDVRAVLNPYYSHLRSELERYGGTVEKFIGDAVMALFGAPIAHEDDPERAVRAAFAIRDWIGEQDADLQVRIAVNTGEALVTLGARTVEGEGMAAGDVVNTTARLQTAAPVNGVLVGETTYRATSHVIDYRERSPVAAKGKEVPIPAWEALQPRASLGLEADRARSPLVGRELELEFLVSSFARVRAERSSQLVTLVGVPGIGKSRLVFELGDVIDSDEEFTSWRQGRSLPYGEGVTFWALAEMVKAHAGILESDGEQQAEEKLRRSVAQAVEDVVEARWIEGHLRPLAGISGAREFGADRRDEAFAAWRRFFEAVADHEPLVLVFEDLHWADEALLDFIDYLVEWASEVPLLVLATTRPELLDARPGWGGGKANSATVSLSPLSDRETAQLIAALLERTLLPAETQSVLLERAGGNPLYAEQFARMLLERGSVDDRGLPESVQGIIAARLDALPAEEKEMLQDAAVLGKVFWLGAVAATAGTERWTTEERLHSLERKEFVRRARRSSVGSETEYSFRHLLVRDVAYGQIPRSARSAKHRLAAEWLDSLPRSDDHSEMLAHHYISALEYARVAGDEDPSLIERARTSLKEAGDRATSLGAYAASARLYASALELWPGDDPGHADLLFRCGRARFLADGTGVELLTRAFDDLRSSGDREGAAEVALTLGNLYWYRGERDPAYHFVDEALELLEGQPESPVGTHALLTRARYHMVAAEPRSAIGLARAGLPMAEKLGGSLHALALNVMGSSLVVSGDPRGLVDLRKSVEIAHQSDSFEELHRSYNNLGAAQFFLGHLADAAETLEIVRRLVERFGKDHDQRWALVVAAVQSFIHGRWEEAVGLAGDFLARTELGSPHYLEATGHALLASIAAARDDLATAEERSAAAVGLARRAKDRQVLAPVLVTRADVLLRKGRVDAAGELAAEVLGFGPELSFELTQEFTPGLLVDLAWLISDLGREADFIEILAGSPATPWVEAARAIVSGDTGRAADILAEMGNRPGEAFTRLRRSRSLVDEGRRAEADADLALALAFYREVRATARVREAERLLAASA